MIRFPVFAAALALSACATVPPTPEQTIAPVEVRVIGLNDFHGNLEPRRRPMQVTTPSGGEVAIPVGGGAHVATAVAKYRAKNEHSLVIAAGDLIGGSPLASAYFLDEPAIGVMNRVGLDYNAVGNHEFDRGWQELKRIQEGGCEQFTVRQPCLVENPFKGSDFSFLAANVFMPNGETLFPAFGVRTFGAGYSAVKIGVIGLTLKDTPNLVTPSGIEGLSFGDEAAAINSAVDDLEAQDVDAIIVSVHQGLYTEVGYNDKSCGGVAGPLIDILKQVDPRVDLVISGHTHRSYVCDFAAIDPSRSFTVTSAGYGSGLFTDIGMTIDPVLGEVTQITANNIIVQSEGVDPAVNPAPVTPELEAFAADPEVAAYVARYVEASQSEAQRAVGRISGDAREPGPSTEETPLGNAIADAQLFATREVGAQIAFMNVSGVRTALDPAPDGTITYGNIFSVQPFSNTLVTRTYTGVQLLALLEQQFDDVGFVQTFAVSDGFAQSYDMSRPAGNRIVSARLNGVPIDPEGKYRITMNNFLASGGDNFTMFEEGSDSVVGPLDLDAFELWLQQEKVRALPPEGRVTDQTGR